MKTAEHHTCSHCGISFRWKPVYDGNQEEGPLFCCRGCCGAYGLICAAGLDSLYRRPGIDLPTVPEDPPTPYNPEELAAALVTEGEVSRLDLLVAGITCPACIWLLERMIGRLDGVESVSFTYAGGIAAIRFDPLRCPPAEICAVITRLGFVPRPYSPSQSEQEERRERSDLLIRFGTALFLTMQLMAYSYGLYAGYFQGISAMMRSVLEYASCLVATPVVFYCGWPFLAGAWRSLRGRRPGMDLLIASGALSAWLYSCQALLTGQETYFESAAMIVTFILLGRLLELSIRRSAGAGIRSLYAAAPLRATLVVDGGYRELSVDEIQPGDHLLVRQGERFPVDCMVEGGDAEVDQSLVTGESLPVVVAPGEEVRAGSINVAAAVTVQALRPVGQSYLMRMAALVLMAQAGKPALQRLADRIAGWFVPGVLALALAVALYQTLHAGADASHAVMAALSIILIACPCAMGLAVPAAVLAACSRAASLGIVFRGGDVIERLARVDHCLLDKTGTVTAGTPRVVAFTIEAGYAEKDVLECLASLESRSAHPVARALVAHAAEEGIRPGDCRDSVPVAGRGISGRMADGRLVICGNRRFLQETAGLEVEEQVLDGATRVLVAIDGRLAARVLLRDRLRPGCVGLGADLARQGIDSRIVSGDDPGAVAMAAAECGVKVWQGGLTPDGKLEQLRALQRNGACVLMVGDGVNDAPALAAADVSCSLTGSSDIALEQADLIIAADSIARLATARRIAGAAMSVIRQNLAWAFLYNLIGIPLAVTGHLTPVYASAAMVASSLLVSLNSLRLMRIERHG